MRNFFLIFLACTVTSCQCERGRSQLKTVVLVAGKKSHGPGEHEYEAGLKILADELARRGISTRLYTNGWPEAPGAFRDAATAVFFCDGADRDPLAHPLLRGERLKELDAAMNQGMGMVALHYTIFVPNGEAGESFLRWIGGYFDYQSGTNQANHWWSKIETRQFQVKPIGRHEITRGVEPYSLREEFYFNLRFPEARAGWKPVVGFDDSDAGTVGWALQRPGGGRGFGYSGGHFHKNWDDPNARRLILNAILWTAHFKSP